VRVLQYMHLGIYVWTGMLTFGRDGRAVELGRVRVSAL
jgi:hypothetical protein